jgi:hypothetical protein
VHASAPRTPQSPDKSADEGSVRAVSAPKEPRLRTDVVRHPDGVQQVVVWDSVTGTPVSETPSSAVLSVVDAAILKFRHRKES